MHNAETSESFRLTPWQVIAIVSFYLLTLQVSLNGDLLRYENSLRAISNIHFWEFESLFKNYVGEPFFALILKVYSWLLKIILFLTSSSPFYTQPPYTLIIPLSVILILIMIYRTSKLEYALFLHAILCLDIGLSLLPFNLLRQYAAFVILVPTLLMYLSGRGPSKLTLWITSLVAALTHWTFWLYVGVLVVEYFVNKENKKLRRSSPLTITLSIVIMSTILVFAFNAEIHRLIERMMTGNFTPPSPTNFICFGLAAVILQKHDGLLQKLIATSCILTLGILTLFGGDALIFERHRILYLPVLIGLILQESSSFNFPFRRDFLKLVLMAFFIGGFIWNDLIVDPFQDRDYFTELFK